MVVVKKVSRPAGVISWSDTTASVWARSAGGGPADRPSG
jgi:hypothetical protein